MIFGISGYIGCGKGTVAEQLTDKYGFRQDSFAKNLKDACAVLFDWPRHLMEGDTKESREWREQSDKWWATKLGIPNFSPRLSLQLVGTNSLRNHFNENIWMLTLENRYRKNPNQHVVISDVRFPNELKFIKDVGGVLIRVDRGPAPVWEATATLANRGNKDALESMKILYPSAHLSEWAWVGTEFDYVLNNNSTIENLEQEVRDIVSKLL